MLKGESGFIDTGTHAAVITGPAARLAQVRLVCVWETWSATPSLSGPPNSVQAFCALCDVASPSAGPVPLPDYTLSVKNDLAKNEKTFTVARDSTVFGTPCSSPGRPEHHADLRGCRSLPPGGVQVGLLGLFTTNTLRSITSLRAEVHFQNGAILCNAQRRGQQVAERPAGVHQQAHQGRHRPPVETLLTALARSFGGVATPPMVR